MFDRCVGWSGVQQTASTWSSSPEEHWYGDDGACEVTGQHPLQLQGGQHWVVRENAADTDQ